MSERMAACPLGYAGPAQIFCDELLDASLADRLTIAVEKETVSGRLWPNPQVVLNGHGCLLHQRNLALNLSLPSNMQAMSNVVNIAQPQLADFTHPQGALEKHLNDGHVPEIAGYHQPELVALAAGEVGTNVLLPLGGVYGLCRRFRDVLMGEAKPEVAPDGRQFPGSGEAADALLAEIRQVLADVKLSDVTRALH